MNDSCILWTSLCIICSVFIIILSYFREFSSNFVFLKASAPRHLHLWDLYDHNRSCSSVQKEWRDMFKSNVDCQNNVFEPSRELMNPSDQQRFVNRAMNTDCLYVEDEHVIYQYIKPTVSNVSHYFVYATAHLPNEDLDVLRRRIMMLNFSINTIRKQFGLDAEIVIVEMYDAYENVSKLFPNVNTFISNVNRDGYDWASYQVGVMHAMSRMKQFLTVTLLNDQMIGPFNNFHQTLNDLFKLKNETSYTGVTGEYYVTSYWSGCCPRSMHQSFSYSLIRTDEWFRYWNRIFFPCVKIGSLVAGEAVMTKEEGFNKGKWLECITTMQGDNPLGKHTHFQRQLATNIAFLYRKGIEDEFLADSDAELKQFLKLYEVVLTFSKCEL